MSYGVYENHMYGNLFVEKTGKDMRCSQCGDSDWMIASYDTKSEATQYVENKEKWAEADEAHELNDSTWWKEPEEYAEIQLELGVFQVSYERKKGCEEFSTEDEALASLASKGYVRIDF